MLELNRPIVFFDIESTGLDVREDRIVELGMIKITNDGTKKLHHLVNPEMPIPAEASAIHGITDEDVANEFTFKEISKVVRTFIKGCDFGGYNLIRFDIPMLHYHLLRCGVEVNWRESNVIDVGNLYKLLNPRTLSAAVEDYLNKNHEDAHGAVEDTEATYEVFKAMLDKHPDLPDKVPEIALYSSYGKKILDIEGKFYEEDGEIYFNFGKHKGKLARENTDYLDWMIGANFSEDTKSVCRDVMNPNFGRGVETVDEQEDDLPF